MGKNSLEDTGVYEDSREMYWKAVDWIQAVVNTVMNHIRREMWLWASEAWFCSVDIRQYESTDIFSCMYQWQFSINF